MDNKIQGYILFGVKAVIMIIGGLFTIWVMQGGDPGKMGAEEMDQLAIREAIDQGLDKSKSQVELDMWVANRGKEIKEELSEAQFGNVSKAIDFTTWIIYLIVFVVIASFAYMFTVDMKKALFSLLGIVGILAFMYIIYAAVGDDVPEQLVVKETSKGVEDADRLFTPGNWKVASAALLSSGILILIAAAGSLFGFVRKMFI